MVFKPHSPMVLPVRIDAVERASGTVLPSASSAAFNARVRGDLEADRALAARLGLRLEL